MYSKCNNDMIIRQATIDDLSLYFEWANEIEVRKQSFNSDIINFESHQKWFKKKLNDNSCMLLVGEFNNIPIGQVRFESDFQAKTSSIGISIDKNSRGKSISSELLIKASNHFLNAYPEFIINAYIKEINHKSIYVFTKAGFKFLEKIIYQGHDSVLYTKNVK